MNPVPDTNDDKTVVLGGAAATPAPPPQQRESTSQNALPVGTRLGEFEIVGLVGEGGFGIVYLAHDHSLERKVALKEYMPSSLASRATDASVAVRSERHRETFEVGRRSFVNEARLLAQFDHPALVKVYRFWEANGTAYMAMPYYDGITLRDALKARSGAPDESWIRKILSPVMDALEIIHHDNCFHRDIAPDNIMLLRDDRPVLLDFGAARRVIGDMTQALTVILKPGYAPIEQYAEMPGMKQGPWTDIYALGAVVYFMITGRTPPPSVGRMMQDNFEPLAQIAAGRYEDAFLRGIDHCLAVKAEDRPQSIADMRTLVGFSSASPLFAPTSTPAPASFEPAPIRRDGAATVAQPARQPVSTTPVTAEVAPKPASRTGIWIGAAVGGLAVAGVGAYLLLGRSSETQPPKPEVTASAPAPAPQSAPVAREASPAQSVPAVPVTPPKAVSLGEAEQALQAAASADIGVMIDKIKTPVVIGKDALTFSLRSNKGGYVYVLLHDKGAGTLSRIYPNALDPDNRIAAGKTMRFPRENWTFDADQPKGDWDVIAMVAESPREFDQLALETRDGIGVATVSTVESALQRGGAAALAGTVHCTDGTTSCSAAYGVSTFLVSETDVAPEPAARKPTEAAPRSDKPAAQSPKPKSQAQPQQGSESEAEYMKKLNKDLDQLLGGKK